MKKEVKAERWLASYHEALLARNRATGNMVLKDATRTIGQEKKALLRIFHEGNWVMRVHQRNYIKRFY